MRVMGGLTKRSMFGMLGSLWRIAKTLGLSEDQVKALEVHENWFQKSKDLNPISPRVVKDGPVLENTDTGDDIDVFNSDVSIRLLIPNQFDIRNCNPSVLFCNDEIQAYEHIMHTA